MASAESPDLEGRAVLSHGRDVGHRQGRGGAAWRWARATVVLVARDQRPGPRRPRRAPCARRATEAVDEVVVADLYCSRAGVRRAAAEFLARHDRLHVLVNDAGAVYGKRRSHGRRRRAHLGARPPGALPAHRAARRRARPRRPGARGHRLLRRRAPGRDRPGRPAGRPPPLSRDGRLRRHEARQHPLHLRARPAPAGRRGGGDRACTRASCARAGAATWRRCCAPACGRPTSWPARPRRRAPRRSSTWPPRPRSAGASGLFYHDRRPVSAPPAAYDEELAAGLWRRSAVLTGLAPS